MFEGLTTASLVVSIIICLLLVDNNNSNYQKKFTKSNLAQAASLINVEHKPNSIYNISQLNRGYLQESNRQFDKYDVNSTESKLNKKPLEVSNKVDNFLTNNNNNNNNDQLEHSRPSNAKTTDNNQSFDYHNSLFYDTNYDYKGSQHQGGFKYKRAGSLETNTDCEYMISKKPVIFGIRCDEGCENDNGTTVIKSGQATELILFGRNLYLNLSVALTPIKGEPQDDCTHIDRVTSIQIVNTSLSLTVAHVIVEMSAPVNPKEPLYFCIREATDRNWYNQGPQKWLKIYVHQDLMPTYMKIIIIACLLGLSGVFSGLNLGLMALDKNELQVIMKCGSETERRYARVIEPVRRNGNYLLCSILFSNTLVNSTISVFLEELSTGLIAIMSSTVLIVLFGEILPQAFCSRHGLAVGAKTIMLTRLCMAVTCPLSWPISVALNYALGDEIGHAYDRDRLMEFIQVTRNINNLETDEVNIIAGALKIKKIQISEIMTRIEDVFMLDETAILDFDTIQMIQENGYSRIPIHEENNRKNILAILFAKDLALVDPDDNTPVRAMISFYNHPRMFIDYDETIDVALRVFKTGESHMALVQRIIYDEDKDPDKEIIGIVTLEDVIEEIMQMEINDETDTLTDNRRRRRRDEAQIRRDFSHFTNLGTGDSSVNVVTPQLCLAAYQYLATTVEPFSPKYLSDSILKRLLSQRIFYKVKVEDGGSVKRLYTAGEAADYFIMILEGRVHVVCGKENLLFDGGPFNFFGVDALQIKTFKEPTEPIQIPVLETPTRKESSVKPILSRRESIVKGISNQLSLSNKRLDLPLQTLSSNSQDPSSSQESSLIAKNSIQIVDAHKDTNSFIPDYTVDIIANTSYLKVTWKDYETACKATLVERGSKRNNVEDY